MEAKDVLEYLGLDADNIDTFKEQFQTKFVTSDSVPNEEKIKSSITGKFTGAFKTKAKQLFNLESEELSKAEKWEDILELGFNKQKAQIEELKQASTQTDDAAIKELNAKLERANQTAREYKEANETIRTSYEQKEVEWSNKFKSEKTNYAITKAYSSVTPKLSDTLTKADKLLLDTEIKKLKVEFDESDNILVMDSEGKRLQNPKQVGTFLGLEEAIEMIADKEGYIKKNNANQGERKAVTVTGNKQQSASGGEREIHPNARIQ
jgi:hypothetical protein